MSLAGIPPTASFVGKLYLFAAAIETNFVWLAIIGLLNTIFAIYYYFRVVMGIYMKEPEKDIKINFSGVRKGEKFIEELANSYEKLKATKFSSIFVAENKKEHNKEKMLNLLFSIEKEIQLYDYKNLFKDLKKVIPNFNEKEMWSKL